jgi:hypothetical protein
VKSREAAWGCFLLTIVLLAYFLPYVVFTGTAAWYGSFLVWTLTGLIIIVTNYLITKNWEG